MATSEYFMVFVASFFKAITLIKAGALNINRLVVLKQTVSSGLGISAINFRGI
jgi:hypothetical protein